MATYDDQFVNDVVDKLKKQGLFDKFRKECLSDIDTKPAYQNLQTRVQGAVDRFLSNHKWTPQLKKNLLRDTLRKHLNELPMLSNGISRVVDQVINPKFISDITPLIDDITCQHLGINYDEWKKNKEEQDKIIADAKIPSLLEIDTSLPTFNKPGVMPPFYPSSNHPTTLNSSNPRFHNNTYEMNNYSMFNPYSMHPFVENLYDPVHQWPLGPIHPEFGVPLPTMPYIPEPTPPLPEEDPQQQNAHELEGPQNQFHFKNNLEHEMEVEAQEISVSSSTANIPEEANISSQNKSYHFEWENYDDNAISDVSVSSVHTSDISSLDDNDDDDEHGRIDDVSDAKNDENRELGVAISSEHLESNLDYDSFENSSPIKPKFDTASSKRLVQRSKAQMKEEMRERKINEKKRIMWQKMNDSLHQDISNGGILIEEEFATVGEEIVEDDGRVDLKDRFITLDEATSDDQEPLEDVREPSSFNDNTNISASYDATTVPFNDDKVINIMCGSNDGNFLFNKISSINEVDVKNINLPESKRSNCIGNSSADDIKVLKVKETVDAVSNDSSNFSGAKIMEREKYSRIKNVDAIGPASSKLHSSDIDKLTDLNLRTLDNADVSNRDKSAEVVREVYLERYDVIDDAIGSEDEYLNADNGADNNSVEDEARPESTKHRSSSIDSNTNNAEIARQKRSKSKTSDLNKKIDSSSKSHRDKKHRKSIRSSSRQRDLSGDGSHSCGHTRTRHDHHKSRKSYKVDAAVSRSSKGSWDKYKDNSKSRRNFEDTSKSHKDFEESSRLRTKEAHNESSRSHRSDIIDKHHSKSRAIRDTLSALKVKESKKEVERSHITRAVKKHSQRELSPITKRLRR